MSELTTIETTGPIPAEQAAELSTIRATDRPESAGHITIAQGMMLLVAVLAVVIRFSALTTSPLSPAEAQQALLVWQFWQPGNLAETNALLGDFLSAGSPAYFSFTSPLLLVFGSGDAVMRLVPAIFGFLIVLLPWLLRSKLGEAGAIVAAFLLAISPLMVAISRTVGGDAIAIFSVFLFIIAWLRYAEEGRPGWFYTLLAALGLGFCSSSLFYTGMITFALALLFHHRFGPGLLPPVPRPDRHTIQTGLIFGIATFLAISTFFFFNLAGLGAAFATLGNWFNAFTLQGNVLDWLEPVFLVLRYEPILLIFGLISLAWATWHGSPFPGLLSYWFTAALFFAILLHQDPAQSLIMILAGYLLVGTWVNSIMAAEDDAEPDPSLPVPAGVLRWGLFISLVIAGATIYFNLSRHLRQVAFSTENISNLLIVIFAFLVAIALVNFVRVLDRRAANQATVLALLVLFGIYSWGTAWWLTHNGAADPRERWVTTATDPGIVLLQEILAESSFQLDNAVDSLEIATAVDHPALRWYLRDFDNVVFGETIPGTINAEALITPAGETLNLSSDYFGADFGLLRHQSTETNISCPARPEQSATNNFLCTAEQALRWWLFHDAPNSIVQEDVILWIRTDLTLEEQ